MPTTTSRTTGSRLRRLALLTLAVPLALGAAVVLLPGQRLGEVVAALTQHTPGEWVRYAQRRLEGHPQLQAVGAPVLQTLQRRLEREVPALLPTLGKGQQPQALAPQRYTEAGRPLALAAPTSPEGPAVGGVLLHGEAEIAAAMQRARPGQQLVVASGHYRFTQALHTGGGGTATAPIVLTALRPGTVTLEFEAVEGITVSQPHWVFENLHLRGVCVRHGDCEHAFHVVGKAHATVLRNNLIEDFNAHVKINGQGGQWPDDGLLQFNTIRNSGARDTDKPVTPVDIVGADGWQVVDNVVAHFVKAQGNRASFGVFMKGGGHNGRIERNLVVCTAQDVSQPGTRAGLSMGGGGTGGAFCRDARCDAEHRDGRVINNIVAHCNDAGIHVFRAAGIVVAHNTLVNTAGIDVRVPPAQAQVHANVLDGPVRARDGGLVKAWDNVDGDWAGSPQRADALQIEPQPAAGQGDAADVASAALDFCAKPRTVPGVPGAVASGVPCAEPVARVSKP